VVFGATLGALIWAGCTTERRSVAYEPAGAEPGQPYLGPQEDLTIWRADTHPEWRTGWGMAFPNPPRYVAPNQISIAVDQPASLPPEAR